MYLCVSDIDIVSCGCIE